MRHMSPVGTIFLTSVLMVGCVATAAPAHFVFLNQGAADKSEIQSRNEFGAAALKYASRTGGNFISFDTGAIASHYFDLIKAEQVREAIEFGIVEGNREVQEFWNPLHNAVETQEEGSILDVFFDTHGGSKGGVRTFREDCTTTNELENLAIRAAERGVFLRIFSNACFSGVFTRWVSKLSPDQQKFVCAWSTTPENETITVGTSVSLSLNVLDALGKGFSVEKSDLAMLSSLGVHSVKGGTYRAVYDTAQKIREEIKQNIVTQRDKALASTEKKIKEYKIEAERLKAKIREHDRDQRLYKPTIVQQMQSEAKSIGRGDAIAMKAPLSSNELLIREYTGDAEKERQQLEREFAEKERIDQIAQAKLFISELQEKQRRNGKVSEEESSSLRMAKLDVLILEAIGDMKLESQKSDIEYYRTQLAQNEALISLETQVYNLNKQHYSILDVSVSYFENCAGVTPDEKRYSRICVSQDYNLIANAIQAMKNKGDVKSNVSFTRSSDFRERAKAFAHCASAVPVSLKRAK